MIVRAIDTSMLGSLCALDLRLHSVGCHRCLHRDRAVFKGDVTVSGNGISYIVTYIHFN